MQKGAKKYFPALLFNFNWLSCFVLFLDFTEPSSLQPTPTTYLRTYVDLSCWRQFHFSIATREPVNGHKDCWKPETSLRLTNIHSFIVLMLFWACTAIHTYYFLTASFIKVSTLNYWDIYCLIHIFKPSSYLDNGKIYLADPCRLIGSLIFFFFPLQSTWFFFTWDYWWKCHDEERLFKLNLNLSHRGMKKIVVLLCFNFEPWHVIHSVKY